MRGRRWLRTALMTLLVAVIGAGAFALYLSQRMIHPPWLERGLTVCPPAVQHAYRHCHDPQSDLGLAFEEVAFPTPDGLTLRGWLLPPDRLDGATVIFVHGAGQDRREGLRYLPFLRARGFGVLLFDLRNHGVSDDDGRGLSYGAREQDDVRAAVRYLMKRGYERQAVIAGGMGAASAVLAAVDEASIKALVLETPYACFNSLARDVLQFEWGIPAPLARLVALVVSVRRAAGSVAPIEIIDRLAPRPVLIIHGDRNPRLPVAHARALHERAGEPKQLWIPAGAGDESILEAQPHVYALRVSEFLETALATPPNT